MVLRTVYQHQVLRDQFTEEFSCTYIALGWDVNISYSFLLVNFKKTFVDVTPPSLFLI